MWSAFSLGVIGDEKALPTLTTLTKDKVEVVRVYAQEAIAKLEKRLKH
jgi:HEAT repeat protein